LNGVVREGGGFVTTPRPKIAKEGEEEKVTLT